MATQYEDVQFDLGTARRPEDQGNVKPYRAHFPASKSTVDGGDLDERDIVFKDPGTLTWQQLMEVDNPIMFLRYVVSEEDRDYLAQYPMEGWQFGELMKRFYKHYKLDLSAARAGRPTAL
jgi:hypothetical protein